MAKQESVKAKISRLIRCAFNEANVGNRDKALELWQSAINKGYIPNERTIKGLEIAIAKGIRETRR